jgi:methyl-accepting chemotaxis protein
MRWFRTAKTTKTICVSKRDGWACGLLVLVSSLCTSIVLYGFAVQFADRELRHSLISTAKVAASLVDGNTHQTLVAQGSDKDPAYTNALKPLGAIVQNNRAIRFAYTCILRNGKVYFVLDPTPPGDSDGDGVDDKSYLLQEYPDADPELLAALRGQSVTVNREPYTDVWGTFMSAYAPIYAEDGSFAGVAGVDMKVDDYMARKHFMLFALLAGTVLSIAASLAIGFFVSHLRKKSFRSLANAYSDEVQYAVQIVASAATELDATAHCIVHTIDRTVNKATMLSDRVAMQTEQLHGVQRAMQELEGVSGHIHEKITGSEAVIKTSLECGRSSQESIQKLSESTHQITAFTTVIQAIAKQVNLLALNATIEAARAGEAGKGFAVVASEVKNLANQTAQAASDIQQYVESIDRDRQQNVNAVEAVLKAIREIESVFGDMTQAVSGQRASILGMGDHIREIAGSARDVQAEIQQLSKDCIQSGDATGEMLHATRELSRQAELLNTNINSFARDLCNGDQACMASAVPRQHIAAQH